MANTGSKWYPYVKVQEGFYDASDSDELLRKIMDYLLDMPDGNGYTPKDDNAYPRCRLWKLLYYDGARPTENPLPTPQEKKAVLFDPNHPERPTEKGYRLFPQIYSKPAQENAQTRIYCYLGRPIAENDFTMELSVIFDIWTNYTQESNTKLNEAYSRTWSMVQCLIQAFHGVNMAGVGTFYFNRSKHPDCGAVPLTDKQDNVGFSLTMGLELMSTTLNGNEENNEVPIGGGLYFG